MLLIVLLYLICAATFTIAKATLAYAQPIFYVGIRMLVAGCALLAIARIRQGTALKLERIDTPLFLRLIIFNIYLAYVLDLWSLSYLTSIESSMVFNLSPFAAALFSYRWFGEIMTPKKWGGLLLGFLALIPLVFVRSENIVIFDVGRMIPLIALVVSVVSSAYGWIIMREIIKVRGYSPLFANGIAMSGGGALALLTSALVEPWSPSPVFAWPEFLLFTGVMILVANVLFFNLYSYLLSFYTATFISFAGFLCPVFTMLFGYCFLGEPLSGRFFVSLCGVAIGLYLFHQEELRLGYERQ